MTNHIQSIQRELKNRDLDAVLITTEVNQRYACGFPFTDGFVLVAREKAWLITDSRYIEAASCTVSSDVEVLLFDNAHPKMGILKGLLHDGLKLAAEENMSITFISSEIEEMLRTCSRLIVMRDRNIVGELTGEDLTQSSVMKTIAGGEQ